MDKRKFMANIIKVWKNRISSNLVRNIAKFFDIILSLRSFYLFYFGLVGIDFQKMDIPY